MRHSLIVHSVRILEGRFLKKYNKKHLKSVFFSGKSAKISFKMMKFDENFTKIDSKNAQIALKHPENEVLASKIRFETDLKHKNH